MRGNAIAKLIFDHFLRWDHQVRSEAHLWIYINKSVMSCDGYYIYISFTMSDRIKTGVVKTTLAHLGSLWPFHGHIRYDSGDTNLRRKDVKKYRGYHLFGPITRITIFPANKPLSWNLGQEIVEWSAGPGHNSKCISISRKDPQTTWLLSCPSWHFLLP